MLGYETKMRLDKRIQLLVSNKEPRKHFFDENWAMKQN